MFDGGHEISSKERTERFYRFCREQITDIREHIASLEDRSIAGGERADAIDYCASAITNFSEAVKDASSYLPAHDQKTYDEAVKGLHEELQKARTTLAPRQKFTFKKKNASALSLQDAVELAAQQRVRVKGLDYNDVSQDSSFATTPAELPSPAPELALATEASEPPFSNADQKSVRKPSFSTSTSIKISNHRDQHIILPTSASHAITSGTLSNLSRCVVDMSVPTASGRPFASLTLKNISDCLIICGHVNGAAHLTKVTRSVIVVASRQFRMHESEQVDVYLHCSSRPIIEDCSDISFGPLPDYYIKDADRQSQNMFDQVDDFKWLKPEPNPNWTTLDEAHRVKDDVWRDVVPGKPGHDQSDILKAVIVPRN